MKIVLSGGWGYGNIGDDVILEAQISLILEKYPKANIVVLTYDFNDSLVHIKDNVTLERGVHSIIDYGSSNIRFSKFNDNYPFFQRVVDKLLNKSLEFKLPFKLSEIINKKHISKLKSILSGTDIYIMSGGGYFNEKWKAKMFSQLRELNLARVAGATTYILGPTIGQLDGDIKRLAKIEFNLAKEVSVRDSASAKEVAEIGVNPRLIPDIAFTKNYPKNNLIDCESNFLGIVYTSNCTIMLEKVSHLIAKYNENQEFITVRLFLTRLWRNDLKMVKNLQNQLTIQGIESEIVIPSNLISLEKNLCQCKLVISENLHGLITAARNSIPVISINDYVTGSPNHKKITSFLDQLQISCYQISKNTTENELDNKLKSVLNDSTYKDRVSNLLLNTKIKYLEII